MDNMGNDIELREAEFEDCDDFFRWRNHPDIRQYFFNKNKVDYEDHKKWLTEKLKSSDTKIYTALQDSKKIGVVRFEVADEKIACVSVNLNPECLQKKLGRIIISKGTEKFISDSGLDCRIIAKIKEDNIRSIKAFEKAGYVFKNRAEGIVEYEFQR
jgi:RimJ/RimL family protein N-acetyltransferase